VEVLVNGKITVLVKNNVVRPGVRGEHGFAVLTETA